MVPQRFTLATHAVLEWPRRGAHRQQQPGEGHPHGFHPLGTEARKCDKIVILSVSSILAEAIRRIHNYDSVSSLFL